MPIINNIVCVSGDRLIKSEANHMGVMSMAMYCKLTNNKTLIKPQRGGNGRVAMIAFDSLPPKYRAAFIEQFGDPRKENELKPLLERIHVDIVLKDKLANYKYGEGQSLKAEVQEAYCNDAAIFNAVQETISESLKARGGCRKSSRGLMTEIFESVKVASKQFEPNTMPSNQRIFERKYKRYIKEGWQSLLHKNFGNTNKSQLENDADALAMFIKIASRGDRYAATTGCDMFNKWAIPNDRKPLTPRTYNNYLVKYDAILLEKREGKGAFANKYDEDIHRHRPLAPLLLINSDDNNLDFFFRSSKEVAKGGNVRTVSTNYYRYKMYLVLDPYCDYVLGYALGDEITTDLVVEAYRNAMNHVKELTGGYYLWNEIVADNWNRSVVKEFFERQAKVSLTKVGNAKAKYIERFFGIEWHETMKLYNNHSGYNIVAQTKPNPDWIKENIKNFPTKKEGVAQIENFINRLRNKVTEDGRTRRQKWLEGFFADQRSRDRQISDTLFLDIFGIQRYKKGGKAPEHNRITNNGINITHLGEQYCYKVPNELYMTTLGLDAHTIIDPADMSRIFVKTKNEKFAFVAQAIRVVPSCLADMTDDDYKYWHSQLYIKDLRKKELEKKRNKLLEPAERLDPEGFMQSGDLTKDINQTMTDAYIAQTLGQDSLHNQITN